MMGCQPSTYSGPGTKERESHLNKSGPTALPVTFATPCRFVRTWQPASTGPVSQAKKEKREREKERPVTWETDRTNQPPQHIWLYPLATSSFERVAYTSTA